MKSLSIGEQTMSKILIALAALLAVALSASPTPQQAGTPLKDVGDLIVGRWMAEVTWAVDYPGIGKKGEKVTGYNVCRWIVDRTAIECEWLLGETTGKAIYWWDAASKQVKVFGLDSGGNWDEGTISKQGPKLVVASSGSFADGRRVEYKWETTFQDNGNTRINTGATILGGVRNEFRDTYKRVAN